MMTAFAVSDTPPADRPGFKPKHAWDAWFFPVMVAIFWVGIIMGFGSDVLRRAQAGPLSFPLIIHVHAVAYMGWMVLLSAQIFLIRKGRADLHRKLGLSSLALFVLMLILGPMATFATQVSRLGTPQEDTAFLAIQLGSLVSFTGLIVAAFLARNTSALHKRLILLGTLTIVDAGFARWVGPYWGPFFGPLLQSPFWTNYLVFYGPTLALMLAIGVFDLMTRGRLLMGYVLGLAWAVAWHVTIMLAYLSPGWAAYTKSLISSVAGN
jgi:hypothetical protein